MASTSTSEHSEDETIQQPEEMDVEQVKDKEQEDSILTEEDLEKTAEEYARYLVVNSQKEKRQLDDRIEQIVFRVEEFKQQLLWMHQNVSSTSEKVSIVHAKLEQLMALFERIDQVEAFLNTVSLQVDQLEQVVSTAEKELQPSTIRKVFSALPGMKKAQRRDSTEPWQSPEVFRSKDFFAPQLKGLEPSSVTPPGAS